MYTYNDFKYKNMYLHVCIYIYLKYPCVCIPYIMTTYHVKYKNTYLCVCIPYIRIEYLRVCIPYIMTINIRRVHTLCIYTLYKNTYLHVCMYVYLYIMTLI